MNATTAVVACLLGYLCGSISSARLVRWVFAPTSDLSPLNVSFPGSEFTLESDAVSATMIRMRMGTRYGILTAVLDMLKVAIPTMVLRLWQPVHPTFLIVATLGLVGHTWPVYHGFKGGRGESAILGGLLVIDGFGIVVTNLVGWGAGIAAGDLLIVRWGWLPLLIPWFWIRTGDPLFVAYAASINVFYWVAMLPELRQYIETLGKGPMPSSEDMSREWGMGATVGRVVDRYSLSSLLRGLRRGGEDQSGQ
jgi:glycerol-3-phosphate acyltransferase PlsY